MKLRKNIHGQNQMVTEEMSDMEILDKYVDLDKSCPIDSEKKQAEQVVVQIYIDFSPFFIRPYHVKEEDENIIDKEMKRLCYLGILRKGLSPYSSPVMSISRKVTKDKRVVTDFRHLNIRIAKNNLAYPLLKATFSVLGSSKCKVLSVLDLKDAFIP